MGSETDWAWLGGFFDGEGCIRGITRTVMVEGKPRHGFLIRIKVSQKDRAPLDWIQAFVGKGRVMVNDKRTGVYCWTLDGNQQVAAFLRELLPWCRCKQDQILLALEIIKRFHRTGRTPLSAEEVEIRLALFKRLSEMKGYGVRITD